MNILVTLDENYLDPLRTMLWSLHQAEPDTPVTLWLIHSRMRPDALETCPLLLRWLRLGLLPL